MTSCSADGHLGKMGTPGWLTSPANLRFDSKEYLMPHSLEAAAVGAEGVLKLSDN